MSEAAELPTMPKVETLGGIVCYLSVDGAVKAATFYTAAFGAKEVFSYPPDDQGRTMHIHLHINGSSMMLGDFYPEHGHAVERPGGFTIQLMVDDCQAWFDRAVAAGCEGDVPPQVMFWGDTWGQVRDPFGFTWAFNQPAA